MTKNTVDKWCRKARRSEKISALKRRTMWHNWKRLVGQEIVNTELSLDTFYCLHDVSVFFVTGYQFGGFYLPPEDSEEQIPTGQTAFQIEHPEFSPLTIHKFRNALIPGLFLSIPQVFVANPNKPEPIRQILHMNRDKLVKFLQEFLVERGPRRMPSFFCSFFVWLFYQLFSMKKWDLN